MGKNINGIKSIKSNVCHAEPVSKCLFLEVSEEAVGYFI